MPQKRTKRLIKFRAWDGGEMIYFDFNSRVNLILSDLYEKGWVMQFTGLFDKNGKEIYEGDIIKVLHGDWQSKSESDSRTLDEYLESLTETYEVVFIQGEFAGKRNTGSYNPWYTDNEGNTYTRLIPDRHGFIEIIGNIYENPEILDNKNK